MQSYANIINPRDPNKQPNWRWERARWLREHRVGRRHGDDAPTLVAKDFQLKEARCRSYLDFEALERKYPGIFWAQREYLQPDSLTRWAIEAYLLARTKLEDIADWCATTVEVIIWYEALFFNVLPYLRHDTYIVNVVMGRSVHHGLMERDFDLLWKMIGYAMGPIALREFIKPIKSTRIRDLDQLKPGFVDGINSQIARKMALAIQTIPVYNNQATIFELWSKSCELEKASGTGNSETLIANNIQAALCALPFKVGQLQTNKDLPRLAFYDEQAAELRADEIMEVAMGLETESHKEALTWKYPDGARLADDGQPAG
jgi:hypothetical protein